MNEREKVEGIVLACGRTEDTPNDTRCNGRVFGPRSGVRGQVRCVRSERPHPLEDVVDQAHAVCGMGLHFGNMQKFGSDDPTDPAVLTYGVDGDANLVLGATEYIVPKEGPYAEEAPDIFDYDIGSEFWVEDTPQEGQWSLHAWVHTKNPSGIFAPFNPREQFHPDGCVEVGHH